jgi:sugar transferase (PEP-CTERM system associated)
MIRLFRVFVPVGSLALLVSEVVLVTLAFVIAAYFTLDYDPKVYLLYDNGLYRILLVTASVVLSLHFHDLYTHFYVKSRILLLQQLSLVMGVTFLAQGLISYASPALRMPIHLMVPGSALAMLGIFGWRILYSKYLLGVVGAQRILFVGANPVVEAIASHITEHPELGMAVVGYIDDAAVPPGTLRKGGKVLGSLVALREIALEVNPDKIVVGMTERRQSMPIADLLELRFSGIFIEEASSTYESVCMRISTLELRPSQFVFSGELGPRPGILFIQAFYNLVLALLGTVVFSPVMLATAMGVKLSSPGPVLYRQTRVGLDGSLFTLYKFRSMDMNAEAETGAVWASPDDPRVTRLGRYLRKFRLDEMPQFFNVVRGDMAIVGPRPERPEFVKTLSEKIPYYRQRHCVKPGITGWAQINYRYSDTLEDTIAKLEYDLYYIKNVSPSLDGYIIFHTLKTMLLSRGSQ